MCGIVGYIGHRPAQPILLEGLRRLEYRGYDSAGLALIEDGGLSTCRSAGRISALAERLGDSDATLGIAHTRWATHGQPTEVNAHPHIDAARMIALVHNGIIENYAALRTWLEAQGVRFRSQTDTEALAQLVGWFYAGHGYSNGCQGDLLASVRTALVEVQGTYGIACVAADQPDCLVVARNGSPLVVGVGEEEYVVASDPSAIVEHTARAVYLNDGEVGVISRGGFETTTLDARPVTKTAQQIEFSLQQIELGGYEHFMLKEICEQPASLRTAMQGRIDRRNGRVTLGGIAAQLRELVRARHVIFAACGTAWHAGLVGEYLFEDLARISCDTDYASEFRYRNPIVDEGAVLVAISQSGETADTLAALRIARDRGALVLGIVNAVGSTIARETDAGVYLHVGPEIGVASTKAFTGQLGVLAMMAAELGRRKHLHPGYVAEFLDALEGIPERMSAVLRQSDRIREAVAGYIDRENWLFLGRGYNYPVALEGALKLKEISYIHAEGMPAAEMKHGPIALINEGMPVVFIATRSSQYDKLIGNIEEVRSRGGHILAVATEGDGQIAALADHVFEVPDVPEPLQPLLTVLPLQLVAYHAAVLRGCNVDKPRNLAKSVTVE